MLKFIEDNQLTPAQVAKILDVTRQEIYNIKKNGEIPLKKYDALINWVECRDKKVLSFNDNQILDFIYNRLIIVHHENENVDYMKRLMDLVVKTKGIVNGK